MKNVCIDRGITEEISQSFRELIGFRGCSTPHPIIQSHGNVFRETGRNVRAVFLPLPGENGELAREEASSEEIVGRRRRRVYRVHDPDETAIFEHSRRNSSPIDFRY